MSGRLLAFVITIATAILLVLGVLYPGASALAMAGRGAVGSMHSYSSPQAAVESLVDAIGRRDWGLAYDNLANKSEFTEPEFVRDLNGGYPSLRTYATLNSFDLHPLHATDDSAEFRISMHWSSVVGMFDENRDLHVLRTQDRWQVAWPLQKEPRVPPQVIPVNYLRWDVIYRGPEDDWGAQDVEAPHVRIVDMHPIERAGGVILLGEVLNEDVVPAFVSVKATLLAKNGSSLATEDAFDKMSHILLPKQVTPFRIDFQNVRLSAVDSIRMDPSSNLIAASADPVIELEDQKLAGLPQPAVTGKLVNQSGQIVNVTHILGTFYDNTGQLVWVADAYANRALLPETPEAFSISVPADISGHVSSYRVVAGAYSSSRFQ